MKNTDIQELRDAMRKGMEQTIELMSESMATTEMIGWNDGFEAAIEAIDSYSQMWLNANDQQAANILKWVAKELRGLNA